MYNLHIRLPKVNAEWAESHLTELSVMGIDEFRSRDKHFWGDQFATRYENVDWDNNALQQHRVDCNVMVKIPTAVESAFKENDLWEKEILHAGDVEVYNQALIDATDMIAELYAMEWARQLRCKAWWK